LPPFFFRAVLNQCRTGLCCASPSSTRNNIEQGIVALARDQVIGKNIISGHKHKLFLLNETLAAKKLTKPIIYWLSSLSMQANCRETLDLALTTRLR
jgi:hypothetical protein